MPGMPALPWDLARFHPLKRESGTCKAHPLEAETVRVSPSVVRPVVRNQIFRDRSSGMAVRKTLRRPLTRLLGRQLEHLEQRVPDHFKLLWLKARQRALNQAAIVDGSHLVDQRVRILLEAIGRSNTNPERFGGLSHRRPRDRQPCTPHRTYRMSSC